MNGLGPDCILKSNKELLLLFLSFQQLCGASPEG
jgi:hypothetical protein